MEPIRILLADSDIEQVERAAYHLQQESDIEVVAAAYSGTGAAGLIRLHQPDLVILDLMLPELDGFCLMEDILGDWQVTKKPLFLVLSSMQSDYIVRQALSYGASYYLLKPVDPSALVQAARRLFTHPDHRYVAEKSISYASRSIKPEQETVMILRRLGASVQNTGYPYLREAILLCIEDRNVLNLVTKTLYPEVAKRCGTSDTRVERSIRHTITGIWEKGNAKAIEEVFGYSRDSGHEKPSNSAFIAVIAEHISLALEH